MKYWKQNWNENIWWINILVVYKCKCSNENKRGILLETYQ